MVGSKAEGETESCEKELSAMTISLAVVGITSDTYIIAKGPQ